VVALPRRADDLTFGLHAADQLMGDVVAPWVQDLGLLVEAVEANRPRGAPDEWRPGAVLRLPFSLRLCREGGAVGSAALMALADVAMMFACAAAWNGYRPMAPIDQTTHFLRAARFDVLANARVIRLGHTTTFGQVNLMSASDHTPVGMVSSAYAML
jgi:acyl-coenzyme A thioesterase PaaI-like protein